MQFVLVQAQQTKTELVTLRKFSYFLQHYFNHYICLYLLVFSEECSSLGGTSDGSCASGFGVCCVCKYIYLTLHCIKPSLTFFHFDFLVNTVGLNMPETLEKMLVKTEITFHTFEYFWVDHKSKYFCNCLATRWCYHHFCWKLEFWAEIFMVNSFREKMTSRSFWTYFLSKNGSKTSKNTHSFSS